MNEKVEKDAAKPGQRAKWVAMSVWASGKYADDKAVAEAASSLSGAKVSAQDVLAWRKARDPQDWEAMRQMVLVRVRRAALELAVTLADPDEERHAQILRALSGLGVREASRASDDSQEFGRYATQAIRAVQARRRRSGR